jgi:hypothetical protein
VVELRRLTDIHTGAGYRCVESCLSYEKDGQSPQLGRTLHASSLIYPSRFLTQHGISRSRSAVYLPGDFST